MTVPTPMTALTARAAGDHDGAVACWRALLDAAPDDWTLALELKHDLKAAWHYPDSDARFRRAARHLPDTEWLGHYSALYAFHGSDLDAIDERAGMLLMRDPNEARLRAIRGDVARQRRDWEGAVAAFNAAVALQPGHPEYERKAVAAGLYARLSARAWPEGGPGYAVWVVNLDRNAERMREMERQLAGTPVPVHRAPAVEGKRLPGAAVQRLTGQAKAARGTLGCFLSHAWVWEQVAAGPDAYALVLEDDVIPLLALPPTLAGLNLPETFDLCFVNDRMEPRFGSDDFAAVPMATVMAGFHPEDNAPGADGYLISRKGAETLLRWVAEDGFSDDVDWRLVAYALAAGDVGRLANPSVARDTMARLQPLIGRAERLDAYVLHPALIRTVGVSSDREDDNRAG